MTTYTAGGGDGVESIFRPSDFLSVVDCLRGISTSKYVRGFFVLFYSRVREIIRGDDKYDNIIGYVMIYEYEISGFYPAGKY